MLEHQIKAMNCNKPLTGTPFNILGFDLIIDEKLKVWVLEVNDHPSLDIYFKKEFMGGPKPTEEDICPVDFYVKSRVVRDAVAIASQKKSTIENTDTYNSLEKILPNLNDT